MFERPGAWPLLLGWLGCSSHSSSDFLLACLLCWIGGLICGICFTTLLLSQAARNIVGGFLGFLVRELQPPAQGGVNRLARYRPAVHEQ